MAGDWIKMEVATPDKPEVLAIAARMGWSDPDYAVGKLFRVWRWFDQQTKDGNAPGVTSALLDCIAGVTGFADAMQTVGWLVVDKDGIRLPGFDRHCGKTAKERAQTARRVANHKSNASGNGASNANGNARTVTGALPREEKRREEGESKRASPRGERLPHVELPQDWRTFCQSERPDLDPDSVFARFADYWRAQPGAKGRKSDWSATWRNWVRDERQRPRVVASASDEPWRGAI